jgi:hypothetical protein
MPGQRSGGDERPRPSGAGRARRPHAPLSGQGRNPTTTSVWLGWNPAGPDLLTDMRKMDYSVA